MLRLYWVFTKAQQKCSKSATNLDDSLHLGSAQNNFSYMHLRAFLSKWPSLVMIDNNYTHHIRKIWNIILMIKGLISMVDILDYNSLITENSSLSRISLLEMKAWNVCFFIKSLILIGNFSGCKIMIIKFIIGLRDLKIEIKTLLSWYLQPIISHNLSELFQSLLQSHRVTRLIMLNINSIDIIIQAFCLLSYIFTCCQF